jgi:hypothetical protein
MSYSEFLSFNFLPIKRIFKDWSEDTFESGPQRNTTKSTFKILGFKKS